MDRNDYYQYFKDIRDRNLISDPEIMETVKLTIMLAEKGWNFHPERQDIVESGLYLTCQEYFANQALNQETEETVAKESDIVINIK